MWLRQQIFSENHFFVRSVKWHHVPIVLSGHDHELPDLPATWGVPGGSLDFHGVPLLRQDLEVWVSVSLDDSLRRTPGVHVNGSGLPPRGRSSWVADPGGQSRRRFQADISPMTGPSDRDPIPPWGIGWSP